MAIVVVFWPMRVFSTSGAALANKIAIRHTVVEIVDKVIWEDHEPVHVDGAHTVCGTTIAFRLYDTEVRGGRPRPVQDCKLCVRTKAPEVIPQIGISGGGWSDALGRPAGNGQGTLLT